MNGFGVFSIIMGIAIVASAVKMIRMAFKVAGSSGWHETKGKVLSSEVRQGWDRHHGQGYYRPCVEDEYRVNGQAFRSHTVSLTGMTASSNRDACSRVVLQYPAGSIVTVYYDPGNPGNPEESCLEHRSGGGGVVLMLFLAGLLMLLGILLPLYANNILQM